VTKRIVISMDEAKKAVDRCKAARMGPCDKCEYKRYTLNAPLTELEGWEASPFSAAFFKRCDACKAPRYPWAPKLDVERVREWMENYFNPIGIVPGANAFMFDQLEHLTK